jgi:hypothetical protein
MLAWTGLKGIEWRWGFLPTPSHFLGESSWPGDAFLRLNELKKSRIDVRFLREFPRLNLTDEEWNAALVSVRWTLAGFGLIAVGFLAQLLLRLVE